MNNEYSEAISEVLETMKYMDEELLTKIPLDVIKKLKEKRLKTYINKFDETRKVDFSKLSDKAIDVLAVLYREYIANEDEKIEFDKMLDENEIKGDGADYTIKKFEKHDQQEKQEENLPAVIKKNFFQRIFEKFFKTNKID